MTCCCILDDSSPDDKGEKKVPKSASFKMFENQCHNRKKKVFSRIQLYNN